MTFFAFVFGQKIVCKRRCFFLILHSAQAAKSDSILGILKAKKQNRQQAKLKQFMRLKLKKIFFSGGILLS
jgi:coproporphyrinogen III oxidase-like Fe-S oxidoreductase